MIALPLPPPLRVGALFFAGDFVPRTPLIVRLSVRLAEYKNSPLPLRRGGRGSGQPTSKLLGKIVIKQHSRSLDLTLGEDAKTCVFLCFFGIFHALAGLFGCAGKLHI